MNFMTEMSHYSAIKWVNENITTDKIILTDIRLFRYFSSNKILAIQLCFKIK